MCRLLLMNKQAEKEIEDIYGVDNYLYYLEKQLGGDGNGYALLKNNKIIKMEKGINLDVKHIAKIILETDYDWCLFHTRRATIGTQNNKNCHPFIRKNICLAMNGTEPTVSFISEIEDMTDTETIIDIMDKYNLGLAALHKFSSIFMGFYNGKPFVVAGNKYNIKILSKKNGALAFASSFPYNFKKDIYQTTECFQWNDNELPDTLIKYKRTLYPPTYYFEPQYYSDIYGQYYLNY